jgi:hypothetical protein
MGNKFPSPPTLSKQKPKYTQEFTHPTLSAPEDEAVCISETVATLPTSVWCKDLTAKSASTDTFLWCILYNGFHFVEICVS